MDGNGGRGRIGWEWEERKGMMDGNGGERKDRMDGNGRRGRIGWMGMGGEEG